MKKSVCIVCIICLTVLSAGALDFGDLNFEIVSQKTESGQEVYQVLDPYGNELTVVGAENLDEDSLEVLKIMLSTLNKWKYLTIGTQRVVVSPDGVEMVLVPKNFTYQGTDLAKYMPSGMQFYYDTYLEYDFRMYKDKLFLRMSGQVFDEEQFCKKLIKALENPILYIQTHNPDYLIEQLGFIASEMETLKDELQSFRREYDLLVAEYQDLEGRNKTLVEEHDLLQNAVVALSNGGLFKLLQPLDKEVLDAVIETKRDAPEMTVKEMVADMKGKGLTVSSKAVAVVFAVFFNDFGD